jgi:hypothetical protein
MGEKMTATQDIKARTLAVLLQICLQRAHGKQIVSGRMLGRIAARRSHAIRRTIGISKANVSPTGTENGATAIRKAHRDGRGIVVCRGRSQLGRRFPRANNLEVDGLSCISK